MPDALPVRVGSDPATTDRIRAVAARLGVDLDVTGAGSVDEIGGRALPPEALEWQVEVSLLRALEPKHVLFLCVANSARSQMAEGLARAVAPEDVVITSAGSEPTRVRPQAIAALAEVGLDISHHRSMGIDDVVGPVDAVITLCAEEVCPVWLEKAYRLHWGLPDPAGASEDPDEEMDAFRSVRDELRRRFTLLFG